MSCNVILHREPPKPLTPQQQREVGVYVQINKEELKRYKYFLIVFTVSCRASLFEIRTSKLIQKL